MRESDSPAQSGRFSGELRHVQPIVGAPCSKELRVASGLDDAAMVHDDNFIGILNGGKAVRNDETGAIFHQVHHRVLNFLLSSCVNTGGGLIQNQYARIGEKGSADGEKLALSLGKTGAGLNKNRIIAIRENCFA